MCISVMGTWRNALRSFPVRLLFLALSLSSIPGACNGADRSPRFGVLALAEHGGIHKPFVDAAKVWLGKVADENNWPWFPKFMGGVRFKDYIATFVSGAVAEEDPGHPIMRGVPD
jgi:hypothetical protein